MFAFALATSSFGLTVVSCSTESFRGDDASAGDAGAASVGGASATGGTSATGGSSGSAGTTSGSGGVSGASGAGAGGEGGSAGSDGGASAQGGASAGGAAGDSGVTGGEGGEAGGTVVDCDASLAPEVDTCVIDEAYGVFVSPAGDDDVGDGSRATPFATLEKALEVASESQKRVYACGDGGAFEERVSLGDVHSGLEMFGGFDCDDWTYGAVAKTTVVSPTPLALHVVEVDDVRIEGFRFEAADGVAPGESSVGAFVVNSMGVVLRRVEIVAGDGVKGADGTLTEFEYPEQETLNGNPEGPAGMGGAQKVCACQGTLMSIGGGGGIPNIGGDTGSKGLPDHGGGLPGMPGPCAPDGGGRDGAPAPATPAASGATIMGSIDAAGWHPEPGADGATGQPGQGGGGGASRNENGHGGGGACGGCGGNGATKGFGGGASIGLLVLDSQITLDLSNLTAANAGSGGNGVAGQLGQQVVGASGDALVSLNSCDGGNGGRGGNGGASGGGAGGISVGIVWTGAAAPLQTQVTIETGMAGVGGLGGEPGVNDGIDGLAQDVLEVP